MANFQPPPIKSLFDDPDSKGPSLPWVQWFQSLVDFINRPRTNRAILVFASASILNGAFLSSGQGTSAITPKRYGELFLTGWLQLSNDTAGQGAYAAIYRTTGVVPGGGGTPNVGDVEVLALGALPSSAPPGQLHSFAFFDTGLSISQAYKYYVALGSFSSGTVTLAAAGQLQVSEL